MSLKARLEQAQQQKAQRAAELEREQANALYRAIEQQVFANGGNQSDVTRQIQETRQARKAAGMNW